MIIKRHLWVFVLMITIVYGCHRESPTPMVDKKIKSMTLYAFGDSAIFSFTYTHHKLIAVTKNGIPYVEISYSSNFASIVYKNPTIYDTLKTYFNSKNLIDSVITNHNKIRIYYRNNTNDLLDSCRYFEGTNLLCNSFVDENYQPITFQQQRPYTCGMFYDVCIKTGVDTATYTTMENQYNIPFQFFTTPLSEGLSFLDLNPLVLMQQSEIYPYKPHQNLLKNWNTFYSILITQVPSPRFHFRFKYEKDTKQRIVKMELFDTLQSDSIPMRKFQFNYFD